MTTLAEHMIVAGAENRPPMLEKSMYDSWASRIRLFIKGKKHVRITRERYLDPLALVANSPTLYNPSQSPQHSGASMYLPPQQFIPVYAAPIHYQYHHTPVNPQQHLVYPQPFISPSVTQHSQADFPQLDSGLDVSTFQQREYPIECINKAMAFLYAMASRFTPSNNQLRTSSNPRNQATIQDGRVTIQQVQGKTISEFYWHWKKRNCYNFKGKLCSWSTKSCEVL
ncbi:hypothetical protein Tco_0885398 [Tanacetum coccineum]